MFNVYFTIWYRICRPIYKSTCVC